MHKLACREHFGKIMPEKYLPDPDISRQRGHIKIGKKTHVRSNAVSPPLSTLCEQLSNLSVRLSFFSMPVYVGAKGNFCSHGSDHGKKCSKADKIIVTRTSLPPRHVRKCMPGTLLEEEVGNMFSRLWRDFRSTTKYAIFGVAQKRHCMSPLSPLRGRFSSPFRRFCYAGAVVETPMILHEQIRGKPSIHELPHICRINEVRDQ